MTPPRIPDFELLRRIGGGSYGDVWLARTVTGIYRAVKIVDRARFPDDRPFLRELEGITRFQRAMGDRPRQVALLHVGRDDAQGLLYYVMELADDVERGAEIEPESYEPLTLKALHTRKPVLSVADTVRLGVDLARALGELHAGGLIHRDVKPSNIIFVQGVPKLADLGLVSSSDHTLTSLGTPGYAPPEGSGSAKADIYGLGKILYELVTGLSSDEYPRLPAEIATRSDAAQMLELNEVLLRACNPDPEERYEKAEGLLDDLLLIQAGKSVQELARARERVRGLARMATVLAVLVVVALAGLAVQHYVSLRRIAKQEMEARQRAEADERLARYTADLHLAQLSADADNLGGVRVSLRRQIPAAGEIDLRGPEWWALWNAHRGDNSREWRIAETESPRSLAWLTDGSGVLWQENAGARRTGLLDLAAGTSRTILRDTVGWAGPFQLDSRAVIGSVDRRILEVDLRTGATEAWPEAAGRIVASTPIGLVTGEIREGRIRLQIWDRARRAAVGMWESPAGLSSAGLSATSLSSSGQRLAVAWFWVEGTRRRALTVSDSAGRELWREPLTASVQALEFSPDGSSIAISGPGFMAVYEAATGRRRWNAESLQGDVRALGFSPDGNHLAAGGRDERVRIWRVSDGQLVANLRGHEMDVVALAWKDSRILASASADTTILEFSIPSGPSSVQVVDRLWSDVFGDFVFSSDETRVAATGADGSLVVLDAAARVMVQRFAGAFQPLAPSRDGQGWLALNKTFRLVECRTEDGGVRETNLAPASQELVTAVGSSLSGRYAALGYQDGSVEVWDLPQARSLGVRKWHAEAVREIVFSRGERQVFSGARDGSLRSADLQALDSPKELPAVGGVLWSLAVDPEDKMLAAGLQNGRIVLIDLALSSPVKNLAAHQGYVGALNFSSDGSRLLSGAQDGMILFWETARFRQIAAQALTLSQQMETRRGIYRVRFSPTSRRFGVLAQDGRFWFYDTAPR